MLRIRTLMALSVSFAAAVACATKTSDGTGGVTDAGTDAAISDGAADVSAPKTCVTPAEIKIVSRPTANANAPDDQDCDPADPNTVEQCKFGRCAGWTDPLDGTSHGKCIATCVEMNKTVGQTCFPGSVCRAFANLNYCLSTDIPLCSADGGAPRGDGGCLKRGATCTFDDDCCSQTCTFSATGAKCE